MILIDCMYVLCCNFYRKREKYAFKGSGVILLATIFMLNILLAVFIIADFQPFQINVALTESLKFYIVGGSFITFLPILYLRYYKITSYEEVNNKLQTLEDNKKLIYYLASLFYLLITVFTTIGYSFYNGGKVNGWW